MFRHLEKLSKPCFLGNGDEQGFGFQKILAQCICEVRERGLVCCAASRKDELVCRGEAKFSEPQRSGLLDTERAKAVPQNIQDRGVSSGPGSAPDPVSFS